MKRIIVSLLIALPISGVVTAVLLFASAVVGMSCHHCDAVFSVFFPYGASIGLILLRANIVDTGWAYIAYAALLLQFPFYAIVIAIVNGWRSPLLVSLLILIVHSIAAVGSVIMYFWW